MCQSRGRIGISQRSLSAMTPVCVYVSASMLLLSLLRSCLSSMVARKVKGTCANLRKIRYFKRLSKYARFKYLHKDKLYTSPLSGLLVAIQNKLMNFL